MTMCYVECEKIQLHYVVNTQRYHLFFAVLKTDLSPSGIQVWTVVKERHCVNIVLYGPVLCIHMLPRQFRTEHNLICICFRKECALCYTLEMAGSHITLDNTIKILWSIISLALSLPLEGNGPQDNVIVPFSSLHNTIFTEQDSFWYNVLSLGK